jgi:hypothetical protein
MITRSTVILSDGHAFNLVVIKFCCLVDVRYLFGILVIIIINLLLLPVCDFSLTVSMHCLCPYLLLLRAVYLLYSDTFNACA